MTKGLLSGNQCLPSPNPSPPTPGRDDRLDTCDLGHFGVPGSECRSSQAGYTTVRIDRPSYKERPGWPSSPVRHIRVRSREGDQSRPGIHLCRPCLKARYHVPAPLSGHFASALIILSPYALTGVFYYAQNGSCGRHHWLRSGSCRWVRGSPLPAHFEDPGHHLGQQRYYHRLRRRPVRYINRPPGFSRLASR